jgi:hypothetical protein
VNDVSLPLAFATEHARVTLTVSVVTGSSRIVQRNVAADVGVLRALGAVEAAVAVAELPGVELLPAAPADD